MITIIQIYEYLHIVFKSIQTILTTFYTALHMRLFSRRIVLISVMGVVKNDRQPPCQVYAVVTKQESLR